MEQFQVRGTAKKRAPGDRRQAITGVNTSGNLEILVERVLPDQECLVDVATADARLQGIQAVTHCPGGVASE